MNHAGIELHFFLSPFANRYFKICSSRDMNGMVTELADRIRISYYNSFSQKKIRPNYYCGGRYHHVCLRTELSIIRPVRYLQARGHSLSFIMEEALFLAFKQGYFLREAA